MMKVLTTRGLVERSALTVKDVVTESETARTVATEYYLGEKLVKRSVWIDIWQPLEMGAA
jgi:hypothetical protein